MESVTTPGFRCKCGAYILYGRDHLNCVAETIGWGYAHAAALREREQPICPWMSQEVRELLMRTPLFKELLVRRDMW